MNPAVHSGYVAVPRYALLGEALAQDQPGRLPPPRRPPGPPPRKPQPKDASLQFHSEARSPAVPAHQPISTSRHDRSSCAIPAHAGHRFRAAPHSGERLVARDLSFSIED